MHADGPRAVGPHGKPVEASASTTASDVGAMRESASQCRPEASGKRLRTTLHRSAHVRKDDAASAIAHPEPSCCSLVHSRTLRWLPSNEKAAVQLLFGDEDTWPPRYSVEAESTH